MYSRTKMAVNEKPSQPNRVTNLISLFETLSNRDETKKQKEETNVILRKENKRNTRTRTSPPNQKKQEDIKFQRSKSWDLNYFTATDGNILSRSEKQKKIIRAETSRDSISGDEANCELIEQFESTEFFERSSKDLVETVLKKENDLIKENFNKSIEELRDEANKLMKLYEETIETEELNKSEDDFETNSYCSNFENETDDDGLYETLQRKSKPHTYENIEFDLEEDGGQYVRLRKVDQAYKDCEGKDIKCGNYEITTVFDQNRNPRMKTISKVPHEDEKYLIIKELISTEKSYIESLNFVIENYMKYFELNIKSGRLIGKSPHIFNNIENIYLETKVFCEDLLTNKDNYENIGEIFKRHKNLLNRYPVYIKNKNTSQELIDDEFKEQILSRETELKDKLGLSSHLLKPVQRLGKYELLLKKLQKCLKKDDKCTKSVDEAIELIQFITRRGDDLLMINMIHNNPYSITDTGDFITKGTFKMIAPKKMEMVLFLFKKKIIFTTKDPKKADKFNFKDYIDVENLSRTTINEELTFCIANFNKKKTGGYVFLASNMEAKRAFMEEVDKLLWQQLQKYKEEVQTQYNTGERTSNYSESSDPGSPNFQEDSSHMPQSEWCDKYKKDYSNLCEKESKKQNLAEHGNQFAKGNQAKSTTLRRNKPSVRYKKSIFYIYGLHS